MKEFFDRCYYPVLEKIEGRPYSQMICAGSDGENAVRQIRRIATGWRLKEVQEPLIICTHAQTEAAILAEKTIPEAELDKCRDIGAATGSGFIDGDFLVAKKDGGAGRDRTDDLKLAKLPLSQLSYGPTLFLPRTLPKAGARAMTYGHVVRKSIGNTKSPQKSRFRGRF